MAVSGKYGKMDINKVGPDEPVFVLRAQDKLAIPAMEMYRALAESHGSPVLSSLQEEIDRFKSWQGMSKLPD